MAPPSCGPPPCLNHRTTTFILLLLIPLDVPANPSPLPSTPPPPTSPSPYFPFLLSVSSRTNTTPTISPWRRRVRPPLAELMPPGDPLHRPLHPPQRNRPGARYFTGKFAVSSSTPATEFFNSGRPRPPPTKPSPPSSSW
jgi:hypothetical protein